MKLNNCMNCNTTLTEIKSNHPEGYFMFVEFTPPGDLLLTKPADLVVNLLGCLNCGVVYPVMLKENAPGL